MSSVRNDILRPPPSNCVHHTRMPCLMSWSSFCNLQMSLLWSKDMGKPLKEAFGDFWTARIGVQPMLIHGIRRITIVTHHSNKGWAPLKHWTRRNNSSDSVKQDNLLSFKFVRCGNKMLANKCEWIDTPEYWLNHDNLTLARSAVSLLMFVSTLAKHAYSVRSPD